MAGRKDIEGMLCGIYAIKNTYNGKVYIGSTVNWSKRRREHIRHLRDGSHHCKPLQHAWIKYGESAFSFMFIVKVPRSGLRESEQAALDLIRNKYNICKIAGTCEGVSPTPEARRKISRAMTGRLISDDIARKNRGRGYSWNAVRGAWEIRIWHRKQEVLHCFCDSEADAIETVKLIRQQIDAGMRPDVAKPSYAKRPKRARVCKGYSFQKSISRWRVRVNGVSLGCYATESEAIEVVARYRAGGVPLQADVT